MLKFIDANEAEKWVMDRRSRHLGRAHFAAAMKEAGDPQDRLRTIHVAGTNGKGSTCYNLMRMLMSQGRKTGLFTSPHLVCHRDRIRIDDEWIPGDDFRRLLNARLALIEAYDLAMFEIDFLIACDWFLEQKVDYAVMETGLGGLNDATNVLAHPELEIITTISYDHMAILGNTLEEIAAQKAGIIKPGTTVLMGDLPACAKAVICRTAEEKGARAEFYGPYEDLGPKRFRFAGTVYELASMAVYQKQNAAVSLRAMQLLGFDIRDGRLHDALEKYRWAGRFEEIAEHPLIVVDGAHNIEGMTALVGSIDCLPHPRIVVFTALKDKQGVEMADLLAAHADDLIITQLSIGRADRADHLAAHTGTIMPEWKDAIAEARKKAGPDGSVLICGSLYLISEARAWILADAH